MTAAHTLSVVASAPARRDECRPDAEQAPLLREVYGKILREERLDQDRTLAEVARTVGMSKQYLSEIERGRKEPSSEILRSVCDALNLPLDQLLRRGVRRISAPRPGSYFVRPADRAAGPQLLAA
jgi:transcriptional regulator with XRE-family HTH domain